MMELYSTAKETIPISESPPPSKEMYLLVLNYLREVRGIKLTRIYRYEDKQGCLFQFISFLSEKTRDVFFLKYTHHVLSNDLL